MQGLVQGVIAAGLVLGAARVGAVPPERCPEVDVAAARGAATAAVEWFERVQGSDGRWLYLVDEDGGDLGGYSAVRHGGVLLSLEQADNAGIAGAGEVAERGLDWVLDQLGQAGDGSGLPEASGAVRTGGTALLVRALLERGGSDLDDELRAMGRFLAGQVLPDGAVSAVWDPVGGRDDDARDRFFTGEVLWALVGLADRFGDDDVADAAERVGRYLPGRDRTEDLFPPVSDHWAAYAYADLGDRMTPAQRAHAERLAGIVGIQVRGESTRWAGGLQQAIRKGPAMGSGVGTLGEAGAGLLRAVGPDGAPGLDERVRCVAGMLVARQETDGPDAVRGAWFADGVSRMDDQQHALSALVLAEPTLADADDLDAVGGGEQRHGWVWLVLAAFVAVNPPRWRPARAPAATLAAGAAVAALVLSGPALDVLDVSPASARVAGGAGLVVAAVATVIRPAAAATTGVVAGALAVLALAVGADDGLRALVGVAPAVLAVVVLPDRWRRPAASAAVAVAAVLVGIDLVVEGVLGV